MRENSYVLGLLDDKNELKNYVIKRSVSVESKTLMIESMLDFVHNVVSSFPFCVFFPLLQIHKYFYIDEGPFMLTLEHLVQHYMHFADGLPTKLRYPVQPIPKPPLPPPPLPPALQSGQGTPPKGSKFFKKICSPGGAQSMQHSDDPTKERKDMDGSPMSIKSEVKERNLSLPSDDLMNHIGLSSPNMNVTLSPTNPAAAITPIKSKKSPRKSSGDIPIFNSLKFPKGRNIIIDGMKSLKISRKDNKSKHKEPNDAMDNFTNLTANTNDNISMSLKNLTFSSDINDDSTIYKVPNNIPVAQSMTDIQNQNVMPSNNLNNGSSDDLDRFTQSDKDINLIGVTNDDAQEDNAIEEIYFVEAPTKELPISSVSFNYVAFKQIPFFPSANIPTPNKMDTPVSNTDNSKILNSAINANVIPPRAESSLSVESTFSNDLELMLSMHNQNANHGNMIDDPKASPNYYIPATSINLNDVLGVGEFGSVYKGHMKCEYQNGESKEIPIAVKTLHDEHCRENRIEFLREASVMIKLSHHCIIKMIGISKVRHRNKQKKKTM